MLQMLPLAAVLRMCPKVVRMETGRPLPNSCRFGALDGETAWVGNIRKSELYLAYLQGRNRDEMQRTGWTQGRREGELSQ